ncbi:hypothetical protein BGZ76_000372 [Entomortierella beljakovae]|nr:hypothetical protein BGZ76_000372 [Entomortierella beljakovae]
MKSDHEDSDILIAIASENNEAELVKEPEHQEQPSATISTLLSETQSMLKKSKDYLANEIEMIEEEVSHMVVEAQDSHQGMTTPPLCSSPPSATPHSPTSSSDTPLTPPAQSAPLFSTALGGAQKSNEIQSALGSSTFTTSSSSRSTIEQGDRLPYSRSNPWSLSSSSSSYSVPTSSLIRSDESVYAAVPISHELYIIPKSSRGFHWNGDLFLKPHQRRSLGVDHIFNMADQQQYNHPRNENGNGYDGSNHGNGLQQNQHRLGQDSSVVQVHEILLDDQETACILPSWP